MRAAKPEVFGRRGIHWSWLNKTHEEIVVHRGILCRIGHDQNSRKLILNAAPVKINIMKGQTIVLACDTIKTALCQPPVSFHWLCGTIQDKKFVK